MSFIIKNFIVEIMCYRLFIFCYCFNKGYDQVPPLPPPRSTSSKFNANKFHINFICPKIHQIVLGRSMSIVLIF